MDDAVTSVNSGDPKSAKISLEYVARNLEKSSAWSAFIWSERQTNSSYTPITLNALPESLTVEYYTTRMDDSRDSYKKMITEIEKAQIAFKTQQLKTMLSLLFNAYDMANNIHGAITGNPLLLPTNLYDMNENAKQTALYIQNNFDKLQQGGLLVKELTKLKDEIVAIYQEIRRKRWDVETLIPEVERIEKAMIMARDSIKSGMEMPVLPDSQTTFDSTPFNTNLNAVESDLEIADMAWESGLEIIEEVKTIADSVYNTTAKTANDTAAYNSFVSSYNTFKTSLTTDRNSKINELQALGDEWRQTLISILETYLNISLGDPVPLADCSDRYEVDASLVLDSSEPRAWKSEYATLLSSPTGPSIVPAQAGIGSSEWHEYTAAYPARLMERVNVYSKAWQSAYSSMSYADWQIADHSVDPSQPYQILLLKRGSLNILLENLNAIRSEANRYYSAYSSAVDQVTALESDLTALQAKADAYRQFLIDNTGTVPDFEFDEYSMVTDTDIPGLSTRITFAADGISVLETETLIEFLKRVMYDFSVDIEDMQEKATNIGNTADRIAFDINRTLSFNDSISSKLSAAKEMLDYKFDYDKDVFLGDGDHGYLFDSLETLDNDLWQHVDTWYYHASPPDIETQILPHVDYVNSLGIVALNRFAYLTERIWEITDNLTFATPEMKPNPWSVGTGFDAGEDFVILAENKEIVDQFTSVRFLKYHKRPYTEPMGYITLDEIRKGLPKINEWVDARTEGSYGTGLVIERVTPEGYIIPLKLKSLLPFTVRVVDSSGNPVPGVAVSLDYDAESLHSPAVSSTDSQGLAVFYPGPYGAAGDTAISFSVVYNPGGETGPSVLASLNTTVTVKADTDGDGCSDEWEILYGFDPNQAFDGEGDFDGDGLTNAQEAGLMTNPLNADTDGDTYNDDVEAAAGSDPLNPEDIPQPPAPERMLPPVMRTGLDWEKMSDYIDISPALEYSFKFQKVIPFKDRIWAFGSNETWSSDDGYRWSKGENIPQWAPRTSYAMTVHNDSIWLIGGIDGNTGDLLSDVWVSDNGIDWTRVRETTGFGPRKNSHVHSFGDNMWLIGGYLYNPKLGIIGDQRDVWKSADGIQWTRVSESAPWPLRRSDSFSSIIFNNKLWIMGGDLYESGTFTTYSDVWNSADGVNWTMVTAAPAWGARYGTGVTAFSNRLWLFGGETHTEGVYVSQNELWISEDGIEWKYIKGPVNSGGMAFSFNNDLWVYYDHVRHGYPMYYYHNELYRSRGAATLDPSYEPAPVVSVPVTLSAGSLHVLAIKDDGTLWAWGENHLGQLGTGNTERSSKPLQVGIDTDWKAVSAGNNFSLGLKTNGTLWAWGQNYYGELGNFTNTDSLSPVQVGTDTDWAIIEAGHSHVLAIKTNGTLWSWEFNNGGQLGDGTKNNRNYPAQVGTDSDWDFASGGSYHSTAIKKDGSVWTWGANGYGQLGTATATESLTPFQGDSVEWAELSSGQISLSSGASFTGALRSDGVIHLWGDNSSGQIGVGNNFSYYTKAQAITPYDAWTALSAGNSHAAGIKYDNTLWAWGYIWNTMPDGIDHLNNTLPIPVSRDNDWVMVVSGGGFSLAQKADGSLWAWGSNGYGQLGNGTNVSSGTPVRVLALGPTEADTNGDWMDDYWEIQYFGDITRDGEGDFDEDGLTDFTEFQIGTLPDNIDSDQDGMPDKWEIDMGLDPLSDDSQEDKDNDGISNLDEYRIIVFHSSEDTDWGEIRWFGVSGSILYFVDTNDNLLKAWDMANPADPVLLGTYSGNFENSGGLRVNGNVLVIADGNGNFQIIDITDPSAMTKAGEYILGGYIQGFDVSDKYICAADADGALQIIDISDPASPVWKSTYHDDGYLGKIFIFGSRVYATLGGNLVQIIDISNPAAPALIGSYDAGDLVWPPAIAFSGTVMAAAVKPWEEGNSLKFIETSDPQALTEIGKYPYFVDYIAMSEGLLIASTGTFLDVIDARNPAMPVRIADINISCGYGSGLIMSGNLLFMSSGGDIAIVDISQFRRPFLPGEKGDVNHDESVDLSDAILIIQMLSGKNLSETVYMDADVNSDGRLGLEELLFILQKTAE